MRLIPSIIIVKKLKEVGGVTHKASLESQKLGIFNNKAEIIF